MGKLLNLSADGQKDLNRAVCACVISNLTLLLPFVVIVGVIITLLDPLVNGGALDTQRMWLLLAGGVVSAVLYLIAYYNEYLKTYKTAYAESEKIRIEVAEQLRRLPLSYFNDKDLSELTTNIMGDCTSVEHTMSHVVPGMVANIITSTLACVLLAVYDWRMALALFAALPITAGLILLGRRLQVRLSERHVKAKLTVSEQVQEYLEGIKVVKSFGLAGEKSASLEHSLHAMMKSAIKVEGITGVFVTLGMMILQVGIGLVTLVGVLLLSGGSIDTVKLLVFILISARIYSPLIVIMTLLSEFFFMLVSTRRMQSLRREPLMGGSEDAELSDFNIEFSNVSFAYKDDDVLKDISLSIPQDGVTALVGPSGSGKTTVSRLIARFWDVKSGAITIGGRDIREIEPEKLMSYMSFVFQDVVLFNDTVMNNIRIGKKDATSEEIHVAARQAHCDEFIREMPQGYDTLIGENGSTLSGGERQRISIARALLKNAPIVLLDEATASLDPENETQIQAAISELVKGRTVIVIAHRLRTVAGASKIAVLESGKLIEQGTSAELLANKDGLFSRLSRIQGESRGWMVGT
jgi:ATP-binding cassette subfamily B protein